MYKLFSASVVFLFLNTSFSNAQENKIAGIGPASPVKKLFGDFKFTEGAAVAPDGSMCFTDIPNERIHKIGTDGKLGVFTEKSHHANGLMFNAKGELYACEMDGQVVVYSKDGKTRRIVAEMYNGKRFNAPNDLVLDQAGGIYFTDPEYNAPNPWPQEKRCFYYMKADGAITRLLDEDLPNPNGIILSPDEKTLYVIPSKSARMLSYPVEGPGKIGKGKEFCVLKQAMPDGNSGGDGLTVDVKGNLYITSGLGIQVFDPVGKHLGIIKVPEVPANVAFGGKEMKTLYMTARTSVYTCEMEIAGHRFVGKK